MGNSILELVKQISSEVKECTKCELHKCRNNAVPGEGTVTARIMFVGEAPGREEDLQGRPFVGMAGRLLSQLLSSIGLSREDVYITNIVKCRPPENRPPRVAEILACSGYLRRQTELIDPTVICLMGNTALRVFLGRDASISKVHGERIMKEKRVVFPLYHPAAALYTGSLKVVLEEDFKKLGREVI